MRRLADPAMHHLNERIGSRAVLQPLTALECRQYIEHRLRLCHGSSDRIFDRRALDLIVQESAGIPRRINALCHNSLLLAYSARARMVTLAMAREAAADYGHLDKRLKPGNILASLPARFSQGIRSLSPVVGVGLLGIAGFVAGQIVMGPTLHPHIGLWGGHPAISSETAPSMRVVSIDPKLPAETPSARAEGEAGPGSAEIESPGLKSSGGEMPNRESETTVVKSGASEAASSSSKDSNTATSEPAAGSDAGRRFVVVAPGDTLALIAIRNLGSIAGLSRLIQLNPNIIDAARVYPGEKVYLPSSPDSSSGDDADDANVE
jgi:hypothetical protein